MLGYAAIGQLALAQLPGALFVDVLKIDPDYITALKSRVTASIPLARVTVTVIK